MRRAVKVIKLKIDGETFLQSRNLFKILMNIGMRYIAGSGDADYLAI